jgi:hypothetical protein
MRVSLFISKDRVKHIVEQFGADRITVVKKETEEEMFDDVDEIIFEAKYQMDFLDMFHAGIRCGMAVNEKK